ncbi:MAG: helix-turn-helix domain-containing protein [Bacillaceae bacterium]|nr:helix-turn-helix domain-containing protein [Bacillaceae bacterium]
MIGPQIKKIRMEKGMSITQLAKRSGVAKSYLSELERSHKSNPSVHLLLKLSLALQVDLNSFIPIEEKSSSTVN